LDVFSIQAQVFIGHKRVRRNVEITENLGIDPTTRTIKTVKVFEWIPSEDSFRMLRLTSSKVIREIMRMKAWSREVAEEEFESRASLLKILAEKGMSHEDFISFVKAFQANPEKVKRLYGVL